ncbi:MAG: ATP-binding protein [Lachnospira sp.]
MDEVVGNVYGEVLGETFTFATKEYFDGDYVKIKGGLANSAELVGEIVSRGISNKYLSSPEVVRFLDDNIDINRYTIYTYTVSSMGVVDNGKLIEKRIPAIPGEKVFRAESRLVEIVYGLEKGDYKVGYLKKMPSCAIKLCTEQLFNPHLFIVGKTGSGKSFFTKNFLSLVNEDVLIFAPSDEYSDMNLQTKCKKYTDYVLDLNLDIISYYVNLNASEEMILKNIIFETKKVYTVQEMIDLIKDYYRDKRKNRTGQMVLDIVESKQEDVELPTYANTLVGKLKKILNLKFSANSKERQLFEGNIIFDMEGYSQLEQECILNYYLFKLSQKCMRTKPENRKKHIVVIEESHNYVPSTKSTLCKETIVRLAREGRKYGISLCFITQRPRFFDQTALSQSGNKIIFSLPNQDDIKHITEEVPIYRSDLLNVIQNQRVGECVIVGDAYNEILQVKIEF